jgi:heptosyltransferase II
MKVAVFLPNWLGDVVMSTPTLRAIRRHLGPDARMVGIIRPHLADTLAGTNWFDELWQFRPRGLGTGQRWDLIWRMRRERFDMAVLLTNSMHTALLAGLGGAKQRIGYVRDGRGPLLTGKLFFRRQGRRIIPAPTVEIYLALAEAIGCPPEPPRLELALTDDEERVGDRIWRDLGLRTDGRVMALNCGGAFGSAKRWLPEHAGKLARRVAEELDHDVLVLCGPGEAPFARQIVGHAHQHPRVFSLADQPLGMATTKSCLQRSRLLISTDSGPRHVAAAFGRPVMTLLGPTAAAWISNPTVHDEFLHAELDCLGCAKRTCPLGHHRCMTELTPERVFEAAAVALQHEEMTCACCT